MNTIPAAIANAEPLIESIGWGDPVPWQDMPQNDWDAGTGTGLSSYFTSIDDRTDGRWRPWYETEDDLARQRAISRKLATMTATRWAAMDSLRYYVFGSGPEIKSQATDGRELPPKLIDQISAVISHFVEGNNFTGGLDWELHDRSREDGDGLLMIEVADGRIAAEFIEPDQLTEPRAPRDLHDWIRYTCGIDCDSFVPQWKFGVLRAKRRESQPLGYHVVYDGSGRDWDFVPASRMLHVKRNVGAKAPRGVGDFVPVFQDMRDEAKLAANVFRGAALQAAIAWIEEMPPGTTQTQAAGVGSTDLTYSRPTNVGAGGGSRSQRATQYKPGSIIRPSPGRQYKAGPMGAERNAGFEIAAQYAMRRIGIRWLMPEYMISGDASNANYASAMVAESPFVKARQADQQFYGQHVKALLWKVVRLAFQHGWIDSPMPWELLRQSVEITVNWPDVVSRNPQELLDRLRGEVELGVTSRRTAATELNRDFDAEVEAGAKPVEAVGDMGGPAAGPFDFPSRALSLQHAAESIQEAVKTGWKGYP